MKVRELSREEYEGVIAEAGGVAAIEQHPVWLDFQATIEGRSPWGLVELTDDDGARAALCALVCYETHGYRYLRAAHGPAWLREPGADDERAALEALVAYVRERDPHQVFVRLAVAHESELTRPCLSTRPYDTTVVMDLTGGEDEILARMKPRGRRDVRKALRESPALIADETERASASFDEYYRVMCETGERDGFVPAPRSDYENMIATLGPEHCRVMASRVDGELVSWALFTICGQFATHYYAATVSGPVRNLVADAQLFKECLRAAELGCTTLDLMGIGSELAPEMMNLNVFKTKFAKDGVRSVAPDRDVPIRRTFYAALTKARDVRDRLREGRG
ncbi:lipid II:glycine glycyltransferase FemX [Thermophilibacter sp.]